MGRDRLRLTINVWRWIVVDDGSIRLHPMAEYSFRRRFASHTIAIFIPACMQGGFCNYIEMVSATGKAGQDAKQHRNSLRSLPCATAGVIAKDDSIADREAKQRLGNGTILSPHEHPPLRLKPIPHWFFSFREIRNAFIDRFSRRDTVAKTLIRPLLLPLVGTRTGPEPAGHHVINNK